jgi:trans-aconitate methyltransferase
VTLPADYFDHLYAGNADPWGFRDRWYERRKRDLTVASLPHQRYARAFEAGCSLGLVTALLADRCDQLLAVDASEAAVREAAREVAARPNVRVERRLLLDAWPADEQFDLVVLSEVGYYLDETDLVVLLDRAVGSLAPGGVLLACHWRHPVADYPQSGDAVHDAIRQRRALHRAVNHEETDLLLEVFTRGEQPSLAQREGLAP